MCFETNPLPPDNWVYDNPPFICLFVHCYDPRTTGGYIFSLFVSSQVGGSGWGKGTLVNQDRGTPSPISRPPRQDRGTHLSTQPHPTSCISPGHQHIITRSPPIPPCPPHPVPLPPGSLILTDASVIYLIS